MGEEEQQPARPELTQRGKPAQVQPERAGHSLGTLWGQGQPQPALGGAALLTRASSGALHGPGAAPGDGRA